MNNHGQGFNKTAEGKLFKLSPSNFNFGTVARRKRERVEALYNVAKIQSQISPILAVVDAAILIGKK